MFQPMRNKLLLILFVIVVLLNWVMRRDPSQPNFEVPSAMGTTKALKPFGTNKIFSDKRNLRQPPKHTIARGHMPIRFLPAQNKKEIPGQELINPYNIARYCREMATIVAAGASDALTAAIVLRGRSNTPPTNANNLALRKRGAALFHNVCATCHGKDGTGDCPVTKRSVIPPTSLVAKKVADYKDGQLFYIITHGTASMEPQAAIISRDDRWVVIGYLRFLQHEADLFKDSQ